MNYLKSLAFLPLLYRSPFKSEQKNPWILQDSDYLDLEIKRSTLPLPPSVLVNGLFAKRTFQEKEIIGEYRGPIVEASNSDDPVFDYEDKMLDLNEKYVLLGRSAVAYANDCIDLKLEKYGSEEYRQWIEKEEFPKHKNCEYNAEFQFKANKVFLVSKREIKEGEEIFLSYGFEYWKVFYEYYDEDGKLKPDRQKK